MSRGSVRKVACTRRTFVVVSCLLVVAAAGAPLALGHPGDAVAEPAGPRGPLQDGLPAAVALALDASHQQTGAQGLPGPAAAPALAEEPPSVHGTVLLQRHQVEVTPEVAGALARLDELPPPTRAALSAFLAAYLAFEETSRALSALPPSAWETEEGTAEGHGTKPPVAEALAGVLAARSAMLQATPGLRDAWAGLTPAETLGSIQLPPVLGLDLLGADSVWEDDYLLLVDVGGDDVYLNNAGGTGGKPGGAALVDLGGNDQYVSGRNLGINGGASTGAGFLVDAAGDDVYRAGGSGTNGGGRTGVGFLLDATGNDLYQGGGNGVNGGGFFGTGLLVDAAGDDTYVAAGSGVNGGAHNIIICYPVLNGCGFANIPSLPAALVDAGGRDIYRESYWSCVDCTILLKGFFGTQLDVVAAPDGIV